MRKFKLMNETKMADTVYCRTGTLFIFLKGNSWRGFIFKDISFQLTTLWLLSYIIYKVTSGQLSDAIYKYV